jgi:hypothetical protein
MSNLDDQTLEILAGLNAAQPSTQQVDYSGFMQDFQPVLNQPNYFVPQQGLLQNTPTLDTLSDLDVMQQRPQVVTNMLDQYPTLESDFQRSFAVSPDTFNMNVYQPLPYDPNYWQSFVNQGGGTTGGGIDLGTGLGLVGVGAASLLGGDDGTTGGTDAVTTTTIDDDNNTIDGGLSNDVITVSSVIGGTGNDTISGGASNDLITVSSVDSLTGDDSIDASSSNNLTTVSDVSGSSDIDSINNNENTNVTDLTSATDILTNLYDTGQITLDELNNSTTDLLTKSSVIGVNDALTSTLDNLGINTSTSLLNSAGEVLLTSGGTGFGYVPTFDDVTGAYTGVKIGFTPNLNNLNPELTASDIGFEGRLKNAFTDFLNNPISDYIPITGDQVLTGVGTALALDQVMKDAKPSNVTAALAGGTKLATGYSNPFTAPLIAGLTIAEQLAPDPSNKTGFSGFDLGTSTSESFGMEGDKFKQGNVDKASAISQGIGAAINTIASDYGLKTEGDILTQTGNRDPLSITFGDQESEQTVNDRLNYSPETGDIINTTDDIARFYYTGQVGNDGSALADNIIKGTNLLSLKAVANDEDTINMKDFRLPAFSEDKVKNQYLDMGLDETAANALTSASRSGSAATSELLGGLLVANTTNEDLFLTDAEKTSLLEKGYTEEQLDAILYG